MNTLHNHAQEGPHVQWTFHGCPSGYKSSQQCSPPRTPRLTAFFPTIMATMSALLSMILMWLGSVEAATTRCVKEHTGVLATNQFANASGDRKCICCNQRQMPSCSLCTQPAVVFRAYYFNSRGEVSYDPSSKKRPYIDVEYQVRTLRRSLDTFFFQSCVLPNPDMYSELCSGAKWGVRHRPVRSILHSQHQEVSRCDSK